MSFRLQNERHFDEDDSDRRTETSIEQKSAGHVVNEKMKKQRMQKCRQMLALVASAWNSLGPLHGWEAFL
uniref:Uncharacterized protein n=1 Tax=Steinernema glaseri TaxID=37863 RepID=A0A1I7XYT8_9BILA